MAKKTIPLNDMETGNSFTTGISTYVDWEPRTNIIDAGHQLIIEVELPGVKIEDVSIIFEKENLLIIRGVKHQPPVSDPDRLTYYLFEREFGGFYKRIVIDFPLDASGISSIMENGVLSVSIPRKIKEKIKVDIK